MHTESTGGAHQCAVQTMVQASYQNAINMLYMYNLMTVMTSSSCNTLIEGPRAEKIHVDGLWLLQGADLHICSLVILQSVLKYY